MNNIPISVLLGILVLLILMSGFFSGSETALMSLNRYRLRHQARQGNKAAQRTALLLEQPDRLISLILLGNNFVNILASAISTIVALRLMGEAGIAVATGLLTLVILVFAEITPKTFATRRAEQMAFFASAIYRPLIRAAHPLVVTTNWISNFILERFKVHKINPEEEHLSSEELRTVVNETAGLIPPRHRDMLLNILDLGTVSVNDIMVARSDIVGIDLEDDWDDIVQQISKSPHSRLLVYRENVDQVVGFIYLRKMLDVLRSGDFTRPDLESRIREPYFIPEGTTLTVQLLNFQREQRRMGLVVDEYGDIEGLLMLEDILGEIVGGFDTDPQTGPPEIRQQADGSFIIDGNAHVRNINKALNWNLPPEGPKTLNGIVLEHFENFPPQGAAFSLYDHPITVLSVDGNRVGQVRIEPVLQEGDMSESTSAAASAAAGAAAGGER